MANIDIPEESINNLGKTQVITEQIINDLKNGMSEELAKAEKKINDEIKNHLITTKNLIDANKKLGEQEEKISAQQTQITEQDEKISAQQTQIVVQNGKISAQQTQIGEHKEKISVQQKQIDKQDKELIEQKENVKQLVDKVAELERKNGSSNNILKMASIAIVIVVVSTIVNKYII